MRRLLSLTVVPILTWAATWDTWNGTAVGMSAGNVSRWDGGTIGASPGNVNAWNGLAAPSGTPGNCNSSALNLGNGVSCVISGNQPGLGSNGTSNSPAASNISAVCPSGSCAIIIAVSYTYGTSPTITDSASNSYQFLSPVVSSGNMNLGMYFAVGATTTSNHTFKCQGTSTYCSLTWVALTGVSTSVGTVLDKQNNALATGATIQVVPTIPTSGVRAIISSFGAHFDDSTAVDSGLTIVQHVAGLNGTNWAVAMAIKAANYNGSTSETISWTKTGSAAVIEAQVGVFRQ